MTTPNRMVRLPWNSAAIIGGGLGVFLVLFSLGAAPAPTVRPAPGVFFVAPNGSDNWSGTFPEPHGQDGPFATVSRARDAVRALRQKQGGVLKQPASILLRGGTYTLREPIRFSPEDSGTAEAPVTIAAFNNETAVLSGGRRIEGWRQTSVDGRNLWMAEIPEVQQGKWLFRQLWINGERRQRARHPNKGYLAVTEIPDATNSVPWSQGQARFRFKAGDLRAWPTAKNAEVRVMNRWVESHLPIVAIDEADRLVRFAKRSVFKLDPGDLYYVEHALELLDQPGEWYLDAAAGRLYYLPMPGENLSQAEVVAPVITQLIRCEGQPEAAQFIDHLNFHGLTFAHTEWYFPSGFDTGKNKAEVWPPPQAAVGGFAQAAVGVPGALRADGLRYSTFSQCKLVHLGTYGLELARGCQHNRVIGCEIGDLGAGGVRIGETALRDKPEEITRGNEVADCHIHDGGRIFHSAIGVWIGQSPDNVIRHNHIHDFYYTGISVGWTWGYARALATNTLVEFNHVHHIGQKSDGDGPILSDMGGIYTLGLHLGSVIRNNLWHDCIGLRYGGWGIYFDEGTTGILAENNVVFRTTHGGFHQHYGKNNIVRNNVFAFARNHQIQRTRPEEHRSFTFERNLVLWDQGKLLDGNYSGSNYLFYSNVYWRQGGGEVRFDKWTLPEWQQRGQDTNALIADPLFVDPGKDNYQLKPESPALRLGFQPIDLRRVGPRP